MLFTRFVNAFHFSYYSDEETRLVALAGLLQILQLPTGQQSTSKRNLSSLESEIVTFLRKCLSQQAEVRSRLYDGLARVSEEKQDLRESIFSLLHGHVCIAYFLSNHYKLYSYLSKVRKSDSETAPNLDKAIDKNTSKILEPLPHLLRVYTHVADSDSIEKLLDQLVSTACSESSLESEQDFSSAGLGLANRSKAQISLGLYECYMDLILTVPNLEFENDDSVYELLETCFNSFVSLRKHAITRSKVKGIIYYIFLNQITCIDKDKSSKKVPAKTFDPSAQSIVYSLQYAKALLEIAANMSKFKQTTPPGYLNLRQNMHFHQYVFEVCTRVLMKLERDQVPISSIHKQLGDFGACLHKYITSPPELEEEAMVDTSKKKKRQQPSMVTVAAQCLSATSRLIFSSRKNETIVSFFSHILGVPVDSGPIKSQMDSVMDMFNQFLRKTFESLPDAAQPLFSIAEEFAHAQSLNQHLVEARMKWATHLLQDRSSENVPLVKALTMYSVRFCAYVNQLNTVDGLVQSLSAMLKDEEQESEVAFAMVKTREVANVMAEAVLLRLNEWIKDAKWKWEYYVSISKADEFDSKIIVYFLHEK